MNEFKVTQSTHHMPCLQIEDAPEALHKLIRNVVLCQYTDDPRYHLRQRCGAFLQGGSDKTSGWILVEFWNPEGAQEFVDYINNEWKKME